MAYSHALLARIRTVVAGRADVVEKKMFGSVAFMVSGRMACGPHGDRLIVRIGNETAQKYIGRAHVNPMDLTGRVPRSFAMVEPGGLRTEAQLRKWVLMAADYAVRDDVPRKRGPRQTAGGGRKMNRSQPT